MKLKDMKRDQQIVVGLVALGIVIYTTIGLVAPRNSELAWQTQKLLFFAPGLVVGYLLGLWIGQSKSNKK